MDGPNTPVRVSARPTFARASVRPIAPRPVPPAVVDERCRAEFVALRRILLFVPLLEVTTPFRQAEDPCAGLLSNEHGEPGEEQRVVRRPAGLRCAPANLDVFLRFVRCP